MKETREKYDGVLETVRTARDAYGPFMASLNDQWTYLGHDLNPGGISSLKPDFEELSQQGTELFEKIDAAMKRGGEYIDSLRASRPAS